MTWECPHGYPAAAGCPVADCPDAAEPSHVERADESEQNVTDSHVFSLREVRRLSDRKAVTRIVYWANHGHEWRQMARDAGYELDQDKLSRNTTEYRFCRDGDVVAVVARVDGEFYAYMFAPEARHWRDRLRYLLRGNRG